MGRRRTKHEEGPGVKNIHAVALDGDHHLGAQDSGTVAVAGSRAIALVLGLTHSCGSIGVGA